MKHPSLVKLRDTNNISVTETIRGRHPCIIANSPLHLAKHRRPARHRHFISKWAPSYGNILACPKAGLRFPRNQHRLVLRYCRWFSGRDPMPTVNISRIGVQSLNDWRIGSGGGGGRVARGGGIFDQYIVSRRDKLRFAVYL